MDKPKHDDHSTRRFPGQSGVTFIELLISIVAAAIVATGLATQVANTVKYTHLTRQQLQATFLVEEKLEEIVYMNKTVGTTGINATTLPDENPIGGDFPEYSRHFTFVDDDSGTCLPGTTANCLKITVIVNAGGEFRAGSQVVLAKQ